MQFREDRMEGALGRLEAALDRVIAVHQDLRLDDGHQSRLLAQGGVKGEHPGIGGDAGRRWPAVTNRDNCAPLGEARAQFPIRQEPFTQSVEPAGDFLVSKIGQPDCTFIYFNARDDAPAGEHSWQGFAHGCPLAGGFIVEDRAADEFLQARRRKQKLAVGPAIFLGRRDFERGESLSNGGEAFVRRQDTFPWNKERGDRCLQMGLSRLAHVGQRSRGDSGEL